MEKELEDLKFKYSFRDYQQETLTMLNKYINDEKIHIVAPPGAGKTILALELLLRIGNKSLILVPTIAIKEQWIERLKKDFINGDKEGLISSEIENPKIITIDTYQALYALKRKGIEVNKIITKNNIKTIILDEAHHLRKVWKKTLKQIIDKLKGCTTISLTATPPYDNETDYKNYMDLCGIIDAKITIPQLVKSKCLCPHQDYIFFNTPSQEQEIELLEYNKQIFEFVKKLFISKTFIKIIALHEYITNMVNNTNNILNEFEFFIAMLSFLKKVGYIPKNSEIENLDIPNLDYSMLNILLKTIIFSKTTIEQEIFSDEISQIKKELVKLGCIDEDNNVNLKYNQKVSNLLTKNYEKLNSICEIINIEKQSLKEELKLVVATDYIKEEYYNIENEDEIKELGVIPVFRKVIAKNNNTNIAVLTGTLIIIPTETKEILLELAKTEYGINRDEIKITELGINFDYSKVEFESKYDRFRVNLITKLFEKSNISVLIGTIALIGEGWDAPFVNSLIMATYISSYVTSNQLRGRAIRIDKKVKNKFSNIWHLICLEKENDKYILGYDYELLSKRFKGFECIDIERKCIDSGIERLNIEEKYYQKEDVKKLNNYMIEISRNRKNNSEIWNQSIKTYKPLNLGKIEINLVKKTKWSGFKTKQEKNKIINSKTKGLIGLTMTAGAVGAFSLNTIISPFSIASLCCLGLVGNDFIKYKKYNSIKYYFKLIAKAVYNSLIDKKLISDKTKLFINNNENKIEYGLKNSSTYEQMIFLKNMEQAIDISSDSRYIVIFYDKACSVPEIFAKNNVDAKLFFEKLKIPNKKLIYTKTEIGKDILLEYKLHGLNDFKY